MSLRTKIFVAGDKNLLCAGNTYQRYLSLTTIFNVKHSRNSFSSLTTDDKIFVASDKSRAVCARLNGDDDNNDEDDDDGQPMVGDFLVVASGYRETSTLILGHQIVGKSIIKRGLSFSPKKHKIVGC